MLIGLLSLIVVALVFTYMKDGTQVAAPPREASGDLRSSGASDGRAAAAAKLATADSAQLDDAIRSAEDPWQIASPERAAQWIADTNGGNSEKRAAAIIALAKAPKSLALPVLRNVLINGEPTSERPLALQSLRDLALYQGDSDNAIRSVVREAIYHGDDEAVAQSAQAALDIIEESAMESSL